MTLMEAQQAVLQADKEAEAVRQEGKNPALYQTKLRAYDRACERLAQLDPAGVVSFIKSTCR